MDKTFCVFGDSVTQAAYVKTGWVELLRQYLEEKYSDDFVNVFNLGVGGDKTHNILKRFEDESAVRKPTDLIFAVGINDSNYLKDMTPTVSEDKFRSNLREIIVRAKKVCCNITFVGLVLGDDSLLKNTMGSSGEKTYTRDRARLYDQIIKKISSENNCGYIPLFDKLEFSDFQDGLHPNDEGHRKIFAEIKNNF